MFLDITESGALITPLFLQGSYRKWTPTIQKRRCNNDNF
ncbi:hypothetical protein THOB06_120117 [Vibrio rotiferianus]|nr:hypothetical protein THOG10_120119 [Vibrio rotiferianus]CAH1562591.1 hypothetical protein THOB06_120117 [Vibrio rotiferianus]